MDFSPWHCPAASPPPWNQSFGPPPSAYGKAFPLSIPSDNENGSFFDRNIAGSPLPPLQILDSSSMMPRFLSLLF